MLGAPETRAGLISYLAWLLVLQEDVSDIDQLISDYQSTTTVYGVESGSIPHVEAMGIFRPVLRPNTDNTKTWLRDNFF